MIKKIVATLVLISVLFCLTGCECKHDFNEATCAEPQTCKKCGETQGEALGHNYENGKCTNCSDSVPIENIGFTNTFGYNTWIRVTDYKLDSSGKLTSVDITTTSYSSNEFDYRAKGFQIKENILENTLIKITSNNPIVYTSNKRSILQKENGQIILDNYTRDGFIGEPVITIAERNIFNDKIVMEFYSDDIIDGYYVPVEYLDITTKKEIKKWDTSSDDYITFRIDVK